MLEWMQDAWTIGSVDYGYQKIRSGVLFMLLARTPTKYSMSGIGNYLEAIPKDDLKANLREDPLRVQGGRRVGAACRRRRGGRGPGKDLGRQGERLGPTRRSASSASTTPAGRAPG